MFTKFISVRLEPFDKIKYYKICNKKSLAQVVFEILRSKSIGVTSLTFQGYVTSSITWAFDSPYAISY